MGFKFSYGIIKGYCPSLAGDSGTCSLNLKVGGNDFPRSKTSVFSEANYEDLGIEQTVNQGAVDPSRTRYVPGHHLERLPEYYPGFQGFE